MSVHKFELTPVEFWEDDEVEIQDIVCGYRMSYRVKLKSTPYLDEKTIDGKEYAGYFAVGYDENNAYELYWSVISEDSLSAKAESFSRLRGSLPSDFRHEELLENKSQAVTPYSNGDCNQREDLNTSEIHLEPKGSSLLAAKDKDCEDASEACDWNKAYVRMI